MEDSGEYSGKGGMYMCKWGDDEMKDEDDENLRRRRGIRRYTQDLEDDEDLRRRRRGIRGRSQNLVCMENADEDDENLGWYMCKWTDDDTMQNNDEDQDMVCMENDGDGDKKGWYMC